MSSSWCGIICTYYSFTEKQKKTENNYIYKVNQDTVTIPQLIGSSIRTTHLCIMVILQNLKERNPPSLLENVISTRIFWDCEK